MKKYNKTKVRHGNVNHSFGVLKKDRNETKRSTEISTTL